MAQQPAPISFPPTDGDLLKAFLEHRQESAFSEIVRRHGGMVLGVCRSVLGNRDDPHDPAQAVFLALVQKAPSLTRHPTLAGWLHRIAFYVASNARRAAVVRETHEREAARMKHQAADTPRPEDSRLHELQNALSRLPEKYRLALILHHLEGRTQDETAALLGCSPSAAAVRLNRARQMLRNRLLERGAAASTTHVVAALVSEASAIVPSAFIASTTHMAVGVAMGRPATAVASASATSLAKEAMRMLFMAKLKIAAFMLAAAILLIAGTATTRRLLAQTKATQPADLVAQTAIVPRPPVLTYRPLPVFIEQVAVPSGLYIGVIEKEYQQPVGDVAKASDAGSPERALAHFIDVIAANDEADFSACCDVPAPVAPQMLSMMRSRIRDPARVVVARIYEVGGAKLFDLNIHGQSAPVLLTLLFEKINGKWVCSFRDSSNAVVQNLSMLARATDSYPSDYVAVQSPQGCPWSIAVALLFGEEKQFPVVLRFNGYALHDRVYPPDASGGSGLPNELPGDYVDALKFYQQSVGLLANGQFDAFAARLGGDMSRKYFAQSIQGAAKRAIVSQNVNPRWVRYAIGSPTLKILIYQSADGPYAASPLRYDELIAAPDGKISQVNFHQSGPLDSLLQSQPFAKAFVEDYIK